MKSFSCEAMISLCAVPPFSSPRRNLALSLKSLVISGRCESLHLSNLVKRLLEIVFHDGPHLGYAHVFSHLSRRSFRIYSHPLSDSFDHLLCSSSARSSLLGRSSDVPSSLNLFITLYTVDLIFFKSLIISEFVPPAQ